MKKLALLILSFAFALSSSQSFAGKTTLTDQEILESQKNFVLAATVSKGDGEKEIDEETPVKFLAPNRRTFYFNTESCGSVRHCLSMREKFDKFSREFARDYNQILEDNNLSDNLKIEIVSESEEAAINILFTDSIGVRSYGIYCSDSDINYYTDDGCETFMNYQAKRPRNMIHYFLLNVASLGYTNQILYSGCISRGHGSTSKDLNFCEIEKKAIVFVHRYLKPGMKKAEVEKLFDKHWDDLEINA